MLHNTFSARYFVEQIPDEVCYGARERCEKFQLYISRLEMYFMMFPFLGQFQFRPMNMFNRIMFGSFSFIEEAEVIPKYN